MILVVPAVALEQYELTGGFGAGVAPQLVSGIGVVTTVPVLVVRVSQTQGSFVVTNKVDGRSGAAALAAIVIFGASGAVDVL